MLSRNQHDNYLVQPKKQKFMAHLLTICIICFTSHLITFVSGAKNIYDKTKLNSTELRAALQLTLPCCKLMGDDSALYDCVIVANAAQEKFIYKENSIINLITYSSQNIVEYSSRSLFINSIYSQMHQYRLQVYTELNGNFEPRDQRWNRVKIILDELNANIHNQGDDFLRRRDEGVASDYERSISLQHQYFVWLDADLIFIDMELSLESIVKEYSNYDIIISAERHAATGVANTGTIVVKNTEWSRDFFEIW